MRPLENRGLQVISGGRSRRSAGKSGRCESDGSLACRHGRPLFFLFTQLAVVWGQPIAGFHTVPVMPLARDARVMRDGDMRCSRIRTQSGPNF